MPDRRTFVIVGASLAGAKAAETLRAEGFDGRIVLIGAEPDRPYERPPLSKDYLRGDADRTKVYVHDETFYSDHEIELRTSTTVTELDVGDSLVVTGAGERVAFDACLLATGAEPRRLTIPGADLPGIHYLRTVEDSDALRAAIRDARHVAVVGAGWIGAEVAASARQMGADVTLLDLAAVPLERVLGPTIGAVYRDLHAEHGVTLRMGTGIEAFHGAGRVEEVRPADGTAITADVVVVGVGVTPRTQLAAGAGLQIDNGIVVDDHLATSAPKVWAAGDVAAAWHPLLGIRLRVEHWANALNQGPAAARNMLGISTSYDRIPYFFSDQYELGMEYSGHAGPGDRVVVRGDLATREFVAFWLHDGAVTAGLNANVWDVTDPIQELVRSRRPVDVDRLTDPDVPLGELVPSEGPQ